jgi:2'-5' RNA ligase
MIALYPDSESLDKIEDFRQKIESDFGSDGIKKIPRNEIHATLRWWKGENADVDSIVKELKDKNFNETFGKVKSCEKLGDAIALMIESKSMQDAFDHVDKVIQNHGGPPSDFPKFKAHVSLFYGDFDEFEKDSEISLNFDSIRLVDNDDRIYYEQVIEKE